MKSRVRNVTLQAQKIPFSIMLPLEIVNDKEREGEGIYNVMPIDVLESRCFYKLKQVHYLNLQI